LAESSDRILRKLGIAPDRYSIHIDEGLQALATRNFRCDTVLLLGIYYHIHNHIDWVRLIRETGAKDVIIDTHLTPCAGEFDNVVRFKIEDSSMITSSPLETTPGFGMAVGGHPSRAFVNFSFRVFAYSVTEVDWKPYLKKWGVKGLEDYAEGKRSTFAAKRVK
jgi:hypothetical protein